MGAAIVVAPPSISAASPEPIEPAAIAAASRLILIVDFIRPPERYVLVQASRTPCTAAYAATAVARTIMCRPPKFKACSGARHERRKGESSACCGGNCTIMHTVLRRITFACALLTLVSGGQAFA